MQSDRIGVVYLCRAKEDKNLFINFVNSYKSYPANCPHDLIILFKGYHDTSSIPLREAQSIFEGLDYIGLELPDEGFDIGSYLAAAQQLNHDYLLFFNTSTRINGNNWLELFYQAIKDPSVGLVGATASYESIVSSIDLINRFSDFYFSNKFRNNPQILDYYRWVVDTINHDDQSRKRTRRRIKHRIKDSVKRILNINSKWITVFSFLFSETKELYSKFPNPHIRSNGFLVSRNLLLNLYADCEIKTKDDACLFESSDFSLTRKIWELGLKTLLVGKNGVSYDIHDWPKSNTFRLGSQENLLISDNQTRAFDNYCKKERVAMSWISWGDSIGAPQSGFWNLDCKFEVGEEFKLKIFHDIS